MSRPDTAAPILVTVIIVTWNSKKHIQRVLNSLESQTFKNFQIYIWDNASSDGCVEDINLPTRTILYKHDRNIGFAEANNLAVLRIDTPFVAFLNPDAFPEPDWLEQLLITQEKMRTPVVASLQVSDGDPLILDGAGDNYSIYGISWRGGDGHAREAGPTSDSEVFAACGAAALFDRALFVKFGGFDVRYFCYFEDVDLCFRMRLQGHKIFIAPRAVVRHVGSASVGRKSYVSMYYGTRNRIFTYVKCMPTALLAISIPLFALSSLFLLLISAEKKEFGGRWNGLIDGLRGCWVYLQDRNIQDSNFNGLRHVFRFIIWNPATVLNRRIFTK